MKFLKRILDFYIKSSLHVGFSATSLVQLTVLFFKQKYNAWLLLFVFSSTVLGYNFVKYFSLYWKNKKIGSKTILCFSFICFVLSVCTFIHLRIVTQLLIGVAFLLTLLYALPFFPNTTNARNWKGVKIYIVSLCWVLVTVVLPIIELNLELDISVLLLSIQRFLLVFCLVLIFEIVDVTKDDPHLQTVPQIIGVERTKKLGYLLLSMLLILEFLYSNFFITGFLVKISLSLSIALFLYFANENRSRYYASFWVEAIPIFWWLILVLS